jgi:hypothetical protein
VRFREDRPEEQDRARAAVAEWREKYPEGTAYELIALLAPEFHPDYGPVLRGAQVEAIVRGSPLTPAQVRAERERVATWPVGTG